MDSITHLAAGVITPLAFRKAPRTGALLLFGLAAGQLPDIDFLAGSGPHSMFALHRGLTHSLGALLIFSLILAALLKLFLSQVRLREMTVRIENGEAVVNKADDWHYSQMFLAALLGLVLHVYLDCMTTFGTQIFWPFSSYRVALPALFIVDFILTVPLLLIMLYCLAGFKKPEKKEKQLKWTRLGLAWAICYPLACLGLSSGLSHIYNREYTEVGTAVEKIHVTPVLFSPIYWKVVAENEREYQMAWVAAYRPFKRPVFAAPAYHKADSAKWAKLQAALPVFKDFSGFAGFPTIEETHRDDNYAEYTFKDLRYIYSVPNSLIDLSGYKKGLFLLRIRQGAADKLIYAWLYLENGSDDSAMWNGVRPPVSLEKE